MKSSGKSRPRLLIGLLVLLSSPILSANPAWAVPCAPDCSEFPVAVDPVLGPLLGTTGPYDFTFGSMSGTLTQDVFGDSSIGAITGMGFRYTIAIAAGGEQVDLGSTGITDLTSIDFSGFLTDLAFIETSNPSPTSVSRSNDGASVRWGWESFGQEEESSVVLYAQTDAASFQKGSSFLTFSEGWGDEILTDSQMAFDTFGPAAAPAAAPVPEPSSLLLLGSGLVGLVLGGRKRLAKSHNQE